MSKASAVESLFKRVKKHLEDLAEEKVNLATNGRIKDPKFKKETSQYILNPWAKDVDRKVTDNAPLYHMEVPHYVVPGIVKDNKFKNQIESGTSQGMLEPESRKFTSQQLFGYKPEELNDAEKYGFMTTKSYKHPLERGEDGGYGYGDVVFDFRPDNVKDRTTLSIGDSLDEEDFGATPIVLGDKKTYPNALINEGTIHDAELLNHNMLDKFKIMTANRRLANHSRYENPDRARYYETQYHGPLTLDDVSGVYKERPMKGEEDLIAEQELLEQASDQFGFPLYDKSGCYRNCREFDPSMHLFRRRDY